MIHHVNKKVPYLEQLYTSGSAVIQERRIVVSLWIDYISKAIIQLV